MMWMTYLHDACVTHMHEAHYLTLPNLKHIIDENLMI